jgi:hypothetical protein
VVDSTIQGSGGLEANIAVAFRDGAEVEIRNSTIADHFGEYQGGIFGNGALRIIDSTLARNGADIGGTGISVTGSLLIEGSTILDNGNHVAGGSGISVDGELLIVNSTIAGTQLSDYAGYGAIALAPGSSGSIVNSTVTGTFYRDAGNYSPADDTPTVGLLIGDGANVIVANSIIDDSIDGTIVSNGANTFRDAAVDGAVAGDRLGVAAGQLFLATEEIGNSGVYRGVPADNGGPTETVALLDSATNPALNAADPADVPATDQRGYLRDATPDIGAFELGGTPPTPPNTLPPLAEKVPLPDSEIHGAPLFLVGPSGDAEIAFVDEVAAFQSSLGVYLVGPDGTIGATSWVFERIEHADASADASAAARPGGGPLAPGDAVQLSDLFDPADLAPGAGFGLFLVANGWALNDAAIFEGGTLEFRANGGPASVTDTVPELVHVAAGGGETLVLGNILHTIDAGSANPLSNTLNPGGTGQVTSGLYDGAFTVAFEDKPLGGGSDRDFNDALFAVEPLVTAEDVVAV